MCIDYWSIIKNVKPENLVFMNESEAALKQAKAHLVFLPPHSPDFNPIENHWSKPK